MTHHRDRPHTWRLFGTILIAAAVACGEAAPDSARIGSSEVLELRGNACPTCEVKLNELAVLGALTDPASVRDDAASRDCMVGQLPSGGFVMSGPIGGGQLFLYGPDGLYTSAVGRRGSGPGEFGTNIRIQVASNGDLFTMDDSQMRISHFLSDGTYVSSFPAPSTNRPFAQLRDGSFVFHQDVVPPGSSVLLRLDPAGRTTERLERPVSVDHLVEFDTWITAPARDGGFWTASMWEYSILKFTNANEPVSVIKRHVDWFPEGGRYVQGAPVSVSPSPLIRFVKEDEAGLLWVYSVVPDEEWEIGISARPSFEWGRKTFDTRVEVWDLENQRVIATGQFDEWLGGVCGSPNIVYTVSEDENLNTRLHVFEPTISDTLVSR